MRAPSEKHLEDWIVNNLQEFASRVDIRMRRIVARQPIFPSGRPDLIVALRLSLAVIELKKGTVDGQAIAQLSRYLGDMRYRYQSLIYDDFPDGVYRESLHLKQTHHGVLPIQGMIIGHSFDNNAYLAGNALDVHLFCYEYSEGDYSFRYADNEPSGGQELDGTDTDFALKELIRHLVLLYEDKDTLKSIYEQEKQS